MHRSRMNGILIDCNVEDVGAAQFWAEALGRPIYPDHPIVGVREGWPKNAKIWS